MTNKHPEQDIYYEFVARFWVEFTKYRNRLMRFEHGGYKIGFAEKIARKKTLLRPGFPDYGFFVATESYTMLYIEFKVKSNKLSPKQKEMHSILTEWGAKCVVCYSAEDGIAEIKKYLIKKHQKST